MGHHHLGGGLSHVLTGNVHLRCSSRRCEQALGKGLSGTLGEDLETGGLGSCSESRW